MRGGMRDGFTPVRGGGGGGNGGGGGGGSERGGGSGGRGGVRSGGRSGNGFTGKSMLLNTTTPLGRTLGGGEGAGGGQTMMEEGGTPSRWERGRRREKNN
jgi:23S rRNA pseudouridine2605 synthase